MPDLAVGAPRDKYGGVVRGAVYILFVNGDGTVKPSHVKIATGSGGLPATGMLSDNDRFGVSVANLGDLDGDNVPELAVGAETDTTVAGYAGAVYILFLSSAGTVKSYKKITTYSSGFTGTLAYVDHFGTSTATLGDLDNDGIVDLAVGAAGDNDGGAWRGAVWVLFLNQDGTVKGHQKISDTAGGFLGTLANSDTFGWCLAGLGDLDGDGALDLAVGARYTSASRGALYILFLKNDGTVKGYTKIETGSSGFTGASGGVLPEAGDLQGRTRCPATPCTFH